MKPASTRTPIIKCQQKLEKRRRKQKEKYLMATRPCEDAASSSSTEEMGNENVEEDICCTPKGKRFRIPEVLTCPPAPKKRRVMMPKCSSTKRSPIAFFASPDIELFFFNALRNNNVSSSSASSSVK